MPADPRLTACGARRERGLALILVLWVLALLALIAAGFLSAIRSETLTVRARIDRAEAEMLADAGVHWATERLIVRSFAVDPQLRAIPVDGRPLTLPLEGGQVILRIQDVGGLVDLNAAGRDVLGNLIRVVAANEVDAEQIADRIVDFRDADDRPLPGGAEDVEYAAAGLAYGAKDAPFERVDELRQIPGIGADLARLLGEVTTVHSGGRGIDPASAPIIVLRAIPDLTESDIARMTTGREQTAAEPTPAPTGNALLIASPGNIFRIRAVGEADTGARFIRDAIVELGTTDRRYRILHWEAGMLDAQASADSIGG